jgi:transposase InsO family protein
VLGKLLKIWSINLKRQISKNKRSLLQEIVIKLKDEVNLLKNALITKPFECITTDITKIEYEGGTAYLNVHKDYYGQKVYGWDLQNHMQTSLVINSFKQAVKQIKNLNQGKLPEMLWHSDQGTQYTSYEYVNQILKIGKISYSTKGTPTDNGGQESFFGRLKQETLHELQDCDSIEELRKLVKKKIDYYNNRRLHTSIKYMTPRAFTALSLKNKKPV